MTAHVLGNLLAAVGQLIVAGLVVYWHRRRPALMPVSAALPLLAFFLTCGSDRVVTALDPGSYGRSTLAAGIVALALAVLAAFRTPILMRYQSATEARADRTARRAEELTDKIERREHGHDA